MIFLKAVVGPIETNCYIVGCETTRECFVVDPGADPEIITELLSRHKLVPRAIINTHAHADHIGANADLKLPIYIHKNESPLLSDSLLNLSGYTGGAVISPVASRFIKEPEVITIGTLSLKVLDTPGHSPGGISLLGETFVITGDALFKESIGRTDLPGSDEALLCASLKKLSILDEKLAVFPGHGPQSTIGHELRHNQWIKKLT